MFIQKHLTSVENFTALPFGNGCTNLSVFRGLVMGFIEMFKDIWSFMDSSLSLHIDSVEGSLSHTGNLQDEGRCFAGCFYNTC